MTTKTVAERQSAMRAARRAAGLKEVRNLWLHPDDEAAVRAYAAKLQRKRARHPDRSAVKPAHPEE